MTLAKKQAERKFLLDCVSAIRELNHRKDQDPVPTTAEVLRHAVGEFAHTEQQLRTYLQRIADSHHIFIIRMVEPDRNMRIQQVDGYVVADKYLLSRVREFYFNQLEKVYMRQFYNRKHASQIIKELFVEIKQHNNTPLGMILNCAIMLQQFEHQLNNAPGEYAPDEADRKLNEILGLAPDALSEGLDATATDAALDQEEGLVPEAEEAGQDALRPRRAIDRDEYRDVEQMDLSGKWGDAVTKFGVEFLLRIHFRKYEFDTVRHLVNTRRVAREKDLNYVLDTLRKLGTRLTSDPKLNNYLKQMSDLQNAVLTKLKMIELAKDGD